MLRCFAVCVIVAMVAAPAAAQVNGWGLEDKDYFNPLSSEPRAARLAVELPGRSDRFPFSRTDDPRHWVWEITVGRELPLFGWERDGRDESHSGRRKNDWGIGVWTPVSFHMIEYMDGDSNPIVNNDYRFAGAVKASWTFRDGLDLNGRMTVGHESTHLGDEFTIFAERDHPDFERINVSYEYVEVAVGVDADRWTVRGGDIRVIGDDGWYSDHLLEPVENPRTIPISRRNHEPWIGAEWRTRQPAWRSADFEWFASADLRFRTVYDYHRASADAGEDVEPTYNILVGIRAPRVDAGAQILREIYFRYYEGVNPHGQFRNQRDYTYFGLGFRFGFDF